MSKPPRLSEVRAEVNPHDFQPPHRAETEHWDDRVDTLSIALVPLWILMDRRWFSNSRLLPNMTTFFSNSSRQWGVLAPLYPGARIHQTQVGSLVPLTRRFHLKR
ncbi:unnamed protein product [Gadus morhua 'NCC']